MQRIVRRCLAKDPDERYQSIQDVSIELKELRREMEGDTQLDFSVPSSGIRSEMGGSQTFGPSSFAASAPPTVGGQTITDNAAAARTTSSAEIIIGEIKKHKGGSS